MTSVPRSVVLPEEQDWSDHLDADVYEMANTDIYTRDWIEMSTSTLCTNKGSCWCRGTGLCVAQAFAVCYVKSGSLPDELTVEDLKDYTLIEVNECDDANDWAAEEIPRSRMTLGSSYDYLSECIIDLNPACTLVSLFTGKYCKSFCFDITGCTIAKIAGAVPEHLENDVITSSDSNSLILLLPRKTVGTIIALLVGIGILPVTSEHVVSAILKDGTVLSGAAGLCRLSHVCALFSVPEEGWMDCVTPLDPARGLAIEAVATASVTASVVLTPRPRFGGLRTSRKQVEFVVHNVK